MRVFVYNSNGYDNTVLSNLYVWPEQPVNAVRKKKKQDFTSVPLPLLKVMIVQITWYLLLMRTATPMSQNHLWISPLCQLAWTGGQQVGLQF